MPIIATHLVAADAAAELKLKVLSVISGPKVRDSAHAQSKLIFILSLGKIFLDVRKSQICFFFYFGLCCVVWKISL